MEIEHNFSRKAGALHVGGMQVACKLPKKMKRAELLGGLCDLRVLPLRKLMCHGGTDHFSHGTLIAKGKDNSTQINYEN
jgi:hypothetical protein